MGAFTDLDISAQRGIRVSETVTRDTLDYNIFTGIDAAVIYRRFSPLTLTLDLSYLNREYYLISEASSLRNDDLYRISVNTEYQFRRWMALGLSYSYRINESDQSNQEYKENRIQVQVEISI